eukprot:IDg9480t1
MKPAFLHADVVQYDASLGDLMSDANAEEEQEADCV